MSSRRLPSLGYEEDCRVSRTALATCQLTDAIALFLEGKYLSAITLAGAAEEVLGKASSAIGKKSVIDQSLDQIRLLRDVPQLTTIARVPDKEFITQWNRARNALKHLNDGDEEWITLNPCDEAYWMIRRALANAETLDVSIENSLEFENWIIENVNT
jgi:hypothetical protein